MKTKSVKLQVLKALRVRRRANLAGDELTYFEIKTQTLLSQLCLHIPVLGIFIRIVRQAQENRLKQQAIRLFEESVKEGIKIFVLLAGNSIPQDGSTEDLIQQAGRYLPTTAKEIIQKSVVPKM